MNSILHKVVTFITQFLLLADITFVTVLMSVLGLLIIIAFAFMGNNLLFSLGGFLGSSIMALLGWVQFYRREAPGFGMHSEFYAMFSGLIMMIAFGITAIGILLAFFSPYLN